MAARRYARMAALTALLAFITAPLWPLLAGCASAPSPTPDISPAAAMPPHDERITLPVTIGLALRHPVPKDRTEHQVLYMVQQSIRSQLHAEYGAGTGDALLAQYWSGDGLTAARHEVAVWASRREQPVGVLVVSAMAYSAPGPDGRATVSYCANWQDVSRGDRTTHVVGARVQRPGTSGAYTTLTLARRAPGGRWSVTGMTEAADSPRCPASAR